MQLIKAIPTEKKALAVQLRILADNYQFDEILKLLNFFEDISEKKITNQLSTN